MVFRGLTRKFSVAALYKKMYGVYPKIGMSGFQAGCADKLLKKLPEPIKQSIKI